MKTLEERKALLASALSFLGPLEALTVPTKPTLCSPEVDLSNYGFKRISWAPYMWIGEEPLPKDHELLKSGKAFSFGLASAYACLALDIHEGHSLLDVCAAPGLKSAYLQLITGNMVDLYVNDASKDRMARLKRLHGSLGLNMPTVTVMPGQYLNKTYERGFFDRILIDAPCSGEGQILSGDVSSLQTWSSAKVKRLHQLQRMLVKGTMPLLKSDGKIIYSTCTLNKIENEKTVKKYIKSVDQVIISEEPLHDLAPGNSYRIMPSEYSIGFFVASLDAKSDTGFLNY
jgi:16S rRNA C967 or C1407 C5-methylase (RsmB/RsmF family)